MGEADKTACELLAENRHACTGIADYRTRWGKGDNQTANVCHRCANLLFQKVQPLITGGSQFWEQLRIY